MHIYISDYISVSTKKIFSMCSDSCIVVIAFLIAVSIRVCCDVITVGRDEQLDQSY